MNLKVEAIIKMLSITLNLAAFPEAPHDYLTQILACWLSPY